MKRYVGIGATHGLPVRVNQICATLPSLFIPGFVVVFKPGMPIPIGAVYLFLFDGTDWYQHAYVKASNTEFGDGFGGAVALSSDGRRMAVGAPGEDSNASGFSGVQSDNSTPDAGAVYLY